MRANETSSVPEWRRPTDQGSNSRQRKASTREGNRGGRGARGRGRGGNGGGQPRKDSTPPSQDTSAPSPKVVVDPPAAINSPAELPPTLKSESKPQPTNKNSAAVSEDSTSVSSQTSARPPNRRRRSQQGRGPPVTTNNQNKLLTVQTSGRKASTEPSSPNPAKDPSSRLAAPTSPAPATELKSDLDAFVEHVRARAAATDRPHTPGSHIDWADDDDSLPDLNEWGYTGDVAASAPPEEPQTSIPPILEDAPLETVIPEVRVEGGEPTPDENKSQDAQPGTVPNSTSPTHKVQKTRSKRGGRSRGDPRTQQIPQALNLTDSVSQDSTLSPIQPTSATTVSHINKPQGAKRQNSNQGQNPRNNQGRTNSKDNGNSGGRQRGRNGVAAAPQKRTPFPAKTGHKTDHTSPVQSQPPTQEPDVGQHGTNPSAQTDPKPAESQGGTVPDKERKEDKPAEPASKPDSVDPDPSPAARNNVPHELEPTHNDVKSNSPRNQRKRNSYNPSHSRSHTFGGRTQSGPQPPDSAPTPNFPHNSFDTNPTPPSSTGPRTPKLGQSPGMRSSGLGPSPKSPGFEKHNRNHSSPSGIGGVRRPPSSIRPVLTGDALSRLAKTLGTTPGSPKKEPLAPSSGS